MTLEFIAYPDREMLALSLANRLAGQLSQHLRVSDSASLCALALACACASVCAR